MGSGGEIINLNVGGQRFSTSRHTLTAIPVRFWALRSRSDRYRRTWVRSIKMIGTDWICNTDMSMLTLCIKFFLSGRFLSLGRFAWRIQHPDPHYNICGSGSRLLHTLSLTVSWSRIVQLRNSGAIFKYCWTLPTICGRTPSLRPCCLAGYPARRTMTASSSSTGTQSSSGEQHGSGLITRTSPPHIKIAIKLLNKYVGSWKLQWKYFKIIFV